MRQIVWDFGKTSSMDFCLVPVSKVKLHSLAYAMWSGSWDADNGELRVYGRGITGLVRIWLGWALP